MTLHLLEFLANGIALGAVYALLAVPMSVVWVTTDVIDVSTGGYAVVAGMLAAVVGMPFGPIVGIVAALALGALAGGIFLGFHKLRRQRDAMLIVLATFALMLAIESGVLSALGTDNRFLEPIPGALTVSGAVLPYQSIFNIGVSVVVMLALATLIVLVGGRMSDEVRRVGMLKAAGASPGFVTCLLLASYLAIGLGAAAVGLVAGRLLTPLLVGISAGLLGHVGGTSVTPLDASLVIGVVLAIVIAATVALILVLHALM